MLKQNLVILETACGKRSCSESTRIRKARVVTSQAEAQAIPGIYVYALPHYLRYPLASFGLLTRFAAGVCWADSNRKSYGWAAATTSNSWHISGITGGQSRSHAS